MVFLYGMVWKWWNDRLFWESTWYDMIWHKRASGPCTLIGLGRDGCIHLSERIKRLIHYTYKSCFQQARFLAIPSQVFHHMALSRNGCVPCCTMDFPFILASSIFLYFFPALCHSKLNGHSMAQFLRPKICRYPRKTYATKTAVAAGPWQTDKREASRIEKNDYFSLVFHVQRIDVITIFKGSPLLTVGYLLGLESYHFEVIFQGFSQPKLVRPWNPWTPSSTPSWRALTFPSRRRNDGWNTSSLDPRWENEENICDYMWYL